MFKIGRRGNLVLFIIGLAIAFTTNLSAQEQLTDTGKPDKLDKANKPNKPNKPNNENTLIVLMGKNKADIHKHTDLVNKVTAKNDSNFLNQFNNPTSARYLISKRRKLGETDNTIGLSPDEIEEAKIGAPDYSIVHPESAEGLLQRFVVLTYNSENARNHALEQLKSHTDVISVSKPHKLTDSIAATDPEFERQWGISDAPPVPAELNIESAWDATTGHAYIGIADGGIPLDTTGTPSSNLNYGEPTHPDLMDNYRKQFSYDFVGTVDEYPDSHKQGTAIGHGTHVTGIIGASANNGEGGAGICWDCSLAIGKRTDTSASLPSNDNTVPAYEFLTGIGVQAVNSSFGDADAVEGFCSIDPMNYFCVALQFMADRDIINIAASGNHSSGSRIDFPASEPHVISVGAIKRDGSRANYSDYSSLLDLVAPGDEILSSFDVGEIWIDSSQPDFLCADKFDEFGFDSDPIDGYGSCSGTSMAAPHITGVVGLMRSTDPLLNIDDIKDALFSSGPNYPVKSAELGHGVPDAALAVDKVLGTVAGNVITNRLTPLFSFYSYDGGDDSFYTSVPQMAWPAFQGTLLPQPAPLLTYIQYPGLPCSPLLNHCVFEEQTPITYNSAYGSTIPSYTLFSTEPVFCPCPTPKAEVYIFTTKHNPITPLQDLVPLYRLSFRGPNENETNTRNIDHVYLTDQDEIGYFEGKGYQLDGIEGYIFDPSNSGPVGTEKLYRRLNEARGDHAIFPASKLTAMEADDYTVLSNNISYIGHVYLNEDEDGDDLIDGFELSIGTCKDNTDTDNDGISDGDEVLGYPRTDPMSTAIACDSSAISEYAWSDNQTGALYVNKPWDYAGGYKFIPQVDGSIDQLGGYFNGTKVIKLFDSTGMILRETTVTASNDWEYGDITPVPVLANVEYTVAVYLAGSGGSYRNATPATGNYFPKTFDNIEIIRSVWANTSTNANAVPTTAGSNNKMAGQADIRFTPN